MRLALGVAVALFVSGCNCGKPGQPGSGTLCGDFSPVLSSTCGFLDRCPNAIPYPIAYRNRAECTDILCYSFTCRLDAQRVNGVTTFTINQSIPKVDSSKVKACSDFLDHVGCDLFTDGGALLQAGNPCEGALTFDFGSNNNNDLKMLGEDCSSGSCAQDLYCADSRYDPDSGLKTCRTCKSLGGVGDVCGNVGCKSGLYCAYQDDGGMNRCLALHASGAGCTYGGECASEFCNNRTMLCDTGGHAGEPCTVTGDCRQGFCDSAGKCSNLLKNGASCTASSQCSNNSCDLGTMVCGAPLDAGCSTFQPQQCASGNCGDSMHCEPPKPDGTACMNASECQSSYCDFSTHHCQPHCYTDADCAAGQYCDFQSEQCRAPGMDGAGCRDDNQCVSGYCNQNSEVCATRQMPGGMCKNNEDCTLDAFCSSNVCQKRGAPGAACMGLDTCMAPFICLKNVCTLINLECAPAMAGEMCAFLRVCADTAYCDSSDNFTCKARAPAGGMCNSDEQCLDGACTNSMCVAHKPVGAMCTASNECTTGTVCLMGTCQHTSVGQRCNSSMPCPSPLFCSIDDTCQAPLQLGESCSSNRDGCATGLYCDQTYKCAHPLSPDAGCSGFRDGECGAGYFCNRSDHCAPAPGQGESCDSTSGCAAGLFCDSLTCAPQLDNGASCSSGGNTACKSGVCDFTYGCLAGNMCLP